MGEKVWIKIDPPIIPEEPILKIGRLTWEKALRFTNDKFFKLEWYGKSPYSGNRMIVRRFVF
jgi:hypothetical protein